MPIADPIDACSFEACVPQCRGQARVPTANVYCYLCASFSGSDGLDSGKTRVFGLLHRNGLRVWFCGPSKVFTWRLPREVLDRAHGSWAQTSFPGDARNTKKGQKNSHKKKGVFAPLAVIVYIAPYMIHCHSRFDRDWQGAYPDWCYDKIPNVYTYI